VRIAGTLLDELLAHVREDPANERCGVIAVEPAGGSPASLRAVGVRPAINVHASPLKFEIDPRELLALYNAIEDDGHALGGIYHSHVRSNPYPSQTDIQFAAGWPGVEWLIVGLTDPELPEVRSYVIEDGKVREVELERE
jgi:[CysO sulfur-carrier protein]-S-L-cysteine hydrolase